MKTTLLFFLLLFALFSCNSINNKQADSKKEPAGHDSKQYNGFISRIHKSNLETDWYKLLGTTGFDKHILDIKNIDWKKKYLEQTNNETYNYPVIEVLDTINYIYLSVTVSPKKT